MAEHSPQRAHFEPDGASLAATAVRDQAFSSAGALARFEFEAGRGNEGTKILMVEWNEDDEASKNHGNWEISWEGKSTVLSERDGAAEGKTHRLYFLIGPGIQIPRIITIAQVGGKTMQTNPLPAIFPPELGVSARTAGKKGVLHTIWGKKRVTVLQKEIQREMKAGAEGIGLDLAIKEKEWIEENFGIGARYAQNAAEPPSSPRSPGGGRLAEKMRGLKLGTSTSELSAQATAHQKDLSQAAEKHIANPLSPETSDMAVSSFALFHGGLSRPRRAVAQTPPSHIVAQQGGSLGSGGMASLDAVAEGGYGRSEENDNEHDDGLFAVTMNPRSPEMTTSPFSFAASDIQKG